MLAGWLTACLELELELELGLGLYSVLPLGVKPTNWRTGAEARGGGAERNFGNQTPSKEIDAY